MINDLNKLEKNIDIKFKNRNILKKCLTHKSYDSKNSNEKLEFLGDRVLGLIITKILLENYPNDKEGSLDKKLASLVNKKKCLEVARSINLDKFILVGNSKKKSKLKIKSYLIVVSLLLEQFIWKKVSILLKSLF